MITRVVKMTFRPENIFRFKEIFYESKSMIQAFEGCVRVELMNDVNNEDCYFTLSYWLTEDDLNNYRQSYLFKNTWSKVKPLFSERAQAWSLINDQTVGI